jgi:membrane protein implicated in regulation of membrane protease activity
MDIIMTFPLTPWFWVGLAAFLMLLELVTGSGFLLCLALSSGLMAATALLQVDMSTGLQILFFCFYALLSVVYWCYTLKKRSSEKNHNLLNKRAEQYIGQVHTLHENLVNGVGKLTIGDSVWLVRAEESLAAETEVVIIGVDGTVLLIKKKFSRH